MSLVGPHTPGRRGGGFTSLGELARPVDPSSDIAFEVEDAELADFDVAERAADRFQDMAPEREWGTAA